MLLCNALATGAGKPDMPDKTKSIAADSVAAVLLWLIAADVGTVKIVLDTSFKARNLSAPCFWIFSSLNFKL